MLYIFGDCVKLTTEDINDFFKELKNPIGKRLFCFNCKSSNLSLKNQEVSDPQYSQIEDRIDKKIRNYFDAKLDPQVELICKVNQKVLIAYENWIKNLEAEVNSLKYEIHTPFYRNTLTTGSEPIPLKPFLKSPHSVNDIFKHRKT